MSLFGVFYIIKIIDIYPSKMGLRRKHQRIEMG